MAYQTVNSVTTSKADIYSKTDDGLGPLEWEIITAQDIDIYLTGAFPGPTVAIRVESGETYKVLSPTRGITRIEAQAVTTTGNVKLRPTIV